LEAVADIASSPDRDAALIEQSWGNPERFAAIFDRYFEEVHCYLARRAGLKAADDLAGEVFLRAFTRRERYDLTRGCARPWLYGIATNVISEHRRSERRFIGALARTHADVAWQGDEDRITERVSASAAGTALAEALAALPATDRDVLLLVALADLGYQEVAQALGIPYGTVCSRLSRARRQIRASLGGVNPAGDVPTQAEPKENDHG
jgi:RNA polymerase sigma factor (sigma-70 family)